MNFQVQVTGIQETLQAIKSVKQAYQTTTIGKIRELIERLMYEGYEIAAVGFSEALYAGTKDVALDPPTWRGETMVLSASGESVAFIEFGTGTVYEEYPDADILQKAGVKPRGQYGKKKGKNPPWVYIGEAGDIGYQIATKSDGRGVIRTYGNPPARAMYNASRVFNQDHVVEVAREVFR